MRPLSLFCSLLASLALGATNAQERLSAAVVLGGYNAKNPVGQRDLSTVELFGCEGYDPMYIEALPTTLELTAATAYPAHADTLQVCGGLYAITGDSGTVSQRITNQCYRWTPEAKWQEAATLPRSMAGHSMFLANDLGDAASTDLVPLIIGASTRTTIYKPATDTWENYESLPIGGSWYSYGCYAQLGQFIYHLTEEVHVIDTAAWTVTKLADVPEFLQRPGKCALVDAGGQMGILLRFGYWFNLADLTFNPIQRPPFPNKVSNLTDVANAMFSFRGKPTIFGNSENCDGSGNCDYTEVLSYDVGTDAWTSMGHLMESRVTHEVIEVPGEFCDNFVEYKGSGGGAGSAGASAVFVALIAFASLVSFV